MGRRKRRKSGDREGRVETEKEEWRQRRGIAFWLQFGRDSIYNNEFVKNGLT